MNQNNILIVDDEPELLAGLKLTLEAMFADIMINTTTDSRLAVELVKKDNPDVVITDVRMPVMDGMELLDSLKKLDPTVSVIVMTAFASIETAVEAVKRGAYDFVCKPFDYDYLYTSVKKGIERTNLIRENINLKRRVSDRTTFGSFVGQSDLMRQFYENIQAVARTDYTVLVRGESGTGKELTAKAIHSESKRKNKTLVMVNCPAIPEHLLESELFGHEKGAFTGADRTRKGLFEEADGGTICLDEIGDIPINVQTKLLRVLQEREIRPLGSDKTRKVDVRVVAATNQDLKQKIKDGIFRDDLYYRLNVVTIWTPPLAQIREDIPLLVNHFNHIACREQGVEVKHFSSVVMDILAKKSWPGNVRQLQNVVRRAVMFSKEKDIEVSNLDTSFDPELIAAVKLNPMQGEADGVIPYKSAKEQVVKSFSCGYLNKLLQQCSGNVSRTAEIAELSRAALQKILKRYQINPQSFR